MSSIVEAVIYLSSLDHLRNLEESAVGVRSIFHGLIVRQRFSQTFPHILADGVGKAVASLPRLVHAVAVRDLGHGRDFPGLQFAEPFDVFKNGIQIAQHASALFLGQLQVSEIGHVGDVFVGNFHAFTTNSICSTGVAEYLLIKTTYRGARLASSRRHPASATSTCRMPTEKLSTRVRSATLLPHAIGQ